MKRTRQEALQAVEAYYDTGKPCKHGHLSKRYTIDGACYACRVDASRLHRQEFSSLLKQKRSIA